MKKVIVLLFLSMSLVACNKDGGTAADCVSSTEAQEAGTTADCTISADPVTGETTGSSNGGEAGSTTGATGGGTTESTTGTTGGGTTGSTTGTTGGGTTGSTTGTTSGGTTGTTTGTTPGGTTSTLPTAAYTFDTNLVFINVTAAQQEKFDKAIEMIKKVVATEEFRSKILNHTYNGSKTFVDNGGFTNKEIYQKILDGAETLQTSKNNTMDMEVELYYAATTTVGYTYPNTKRIWVNTKYFNTNSVGSVAANLFHEWLHKVGFKHAVSYSTSRDYSVPYAVGRLIKNIGATLD